MLFQKNILKKYAALLPAEAVRAAWTQYKAYFLDPAVQQNIRRLKEEQFQEGFLRELFVRVLGYTLSPSPQFNLVSELKNEANAGKADGAILLEGRVVGIIELKDHKTTDLTRVEPQAFTYKSQHPDARLVVIANFERLRLYVDNAVEHREWNLFRMSEEEFGELWLCLAWPQVEQGVAIRMKEESVSSEDQITQALYRDYRQFKRVLYADLAERNPAREGYTAEEWHALLFKKTQKLLDRLLFIFFAEDGGLLPPNSMMRIIEQWEQLRELDAYQPLYDRLKQFFGYMDTGYRGKQYEIFAYNGGLFRTDELLDSLAIGDAPLLEHTRPLAAYDYESEVDVNILGHIFESSLGAADRKHDGVFYTPQYITRYIVEQTVGRLCADKKRELGIRESDYADARQLSKAQKGKLKAQLDHYRDYLLGLTILDPACGSGAFLNAALQFLMAEHALIDELTSQLDPGSIPFQWIESSILEHNLYGVDVNEESVEIAQLSLWLRTARPRRKLNTLSGNIKCGNSLVADPAVGGDKAFDWQREFPQVFSKGGFDVVLGNPPYVHLESILDVSAQLSQCGFSTYNKRGDMYCLFVEQAFRLVKQGGLVSYIMPNKWLQAGYGRELRQFFLTRRLERLIDFGDLQIFEGATTYPCIFVAQNAEPASAMKVSVLSGAEAANFEQSVNRSEEVFDLVQFSGDTWVISSRREKQLLAHLSASHPTLHEAIGGEAYRGVLTGLTEAFLIDEETYRQLTAADAHAAERIHPFLQGRHITPYGHAEAASRLILFEKGWTQASAGHPLADEAEAWQYLQSAYPSIASWLEPFAERGRSRTDKGDYWWELRACDYYNQFSKPKIMYQAFQVKPCFIYDAEGFYCNNSMWFIPTESKALLAILNSKMGWWLITKFCTQIQNGCQLIWKYFSQIPIPANYHNDALSALADEMLRLNRQLQEKRARFLRRLQENLGSLKITAAIQAFDALQFADLLRELKKQKVRLTLPQQDEWEDYFDAYRTDCQSLSAQLSATTHQIDLQVYTLYHLSDEEISTVEGQMNGK